MQLVLLISGECHDTLLTINEHWFRKWLGQAPSHYLNQCWPSFMRLWCVSRPQWVKWLHASRSKSHKISLRVPTNPASLRPIMTPSLLIEVCIDAIHVRVQQFKDCIAVQNWQVHKFNTSIDIMQTNTKQCNRACIILIQQCLLMCHHNCLAMF